MGHAFLELNKPDEAINILSLAEKIAPNSDKIFLVYKNMGRAFFMLDDYNKANNYFKLSVKHQPFEIPETLYHLAQSYDAIGLKSESIDTWRHYINIETDTLKKTQATNHLEEILNLQQQ